VGREELDEKFRCIKDDMDARFSRLEKKFADKLAEQVVN